MKHFFRLGTLVLLLSAAPARAERKYQFGFQLDLFGGVTNWLGATQAGGSLTDLHTRKLVPYYGTYPSMTFKTQGRAFELEASYTFLWERHQGERKLDLHSHVGEMRLASQLSKRLRLTLADRFYSTPDLSTYVLSRGIVEVPEGFRYVYDPLPARAGFRTNHGRAALDLEIGKQSALNFVAASDYRHYELESSVLSRLSDQMRYEGSAGWSRKSTKHHTWKIKYTAIHNEYRGYGRATTQSATAGFSHELRPSVNLSMEGGPAYTKISQSSDTFYGFVAEAGLSSGIRSNRLWLYYSHRPGDSSGIGTVSDTDSAGLSFIHFFGRRFAGNLVASAYRSKQRIEPIIYEGIRGGLQLSWLWNEHAVLSCGGSYRFVEGVRDLNREYKLLYVSISFRAPDFWKISR